MKLDHRILRLWLFLKRREREQTTLSHGIGHSMQANLIRLMAQFSVTRKSPRIFLPDTRGRIQSGSSPAVNPTAVLALPGAAPAVRRVPVIA